MLIEALTPLRVKADGKRFALEPGVERDLLIRKLFVGNTVL